MSEHPISNLLNISLENLKEMVDVNTIIGSSITFGASTIIPVAKMKCTFATGGTDQFPSSTKADNPYPFGGATGGTVNISPVAFLVSDGKNVSLLHIDEEVHLYEKLIDSVPDFAKKIKETFNKNEKPTITKLEVIERKTNEE